MGFALLGLAALGFAPAVPGGLAGAVGAEAEVAVEEVGRWEQPLRQCRVERRAPGAPPGPSPGTPQRAVACRTLRLDQQLPGLLSLRLLGGDSGAVDSPGQLVFAGVLEPGSRPLRCRQLRCRPQGAVRMQVSAMARSVLPQDPGATTLLRSQLAQGQCVLEGRRLRCLVRGADGEEWRVEGQR
ncbi:MAG: hypothetical protein VKJ05_09135 [Synechococcaceae cyanobacterium]|nr:hypothetical protein [Synechococcaceae cyanobacterium]